MSGFLNSILRSDDNTPSRPSKSDFPLREERDPRVLYVLSERAKRISLKVKQTELAANWLYLVLILRASRGGFGDFLSEKPGLNLKLQVIIMRLNLRSGLVKFRCAILKADGVAVLHEMAKDISLILGALYVHRLKS